MSPCTFAILLAVAAAAPAAAQTPVGQTGGRYQMQSVEGGIARLDTRTGEISFCRVEKSRIACDSATEETTALRGQVDALSERLEALQDPSTSSSTKEMEAAADQLRFFLRTFRDIVRELREEPGEQDLKPGKLPVRG